MAASREVERKRDVCVFFFFSERVIIDLFFPDFRGEPKCLWREFSLDSACGRYVVLALCAFLLRIVPVDEYQGAFLWTACNCPTRIAHFESRLDYKADSVFALLSLRTILFSADSVLRRRAASPTDFCLSACFRSCRTTRAF